MTVRICAMNTVIINKEPVELFKILSVWMVKSKRVRAKKCCQGMSLNLLVILTFYYLN